MRISSLTGKKTVLVAGDIVVLYAALYSALALRNASLPDSRIFEQHLAPFTALFAVWLIIFYISNLYDLTYASNNAKFYAVTTQALLINFLLGAAFFYLNPYIAIAPKTNLLLTIIMTAILFFAWRQAFNAFLKSYLPKNNVALIGYNTQVRELVKQLYDYPHLGFSLACIITDRPIENEYGLYNVPVYSDITRIKELFERYDISIAVVTEDITQSHELRTRLFATLHLGVDFISLPHFYEQIMGKIPVTSINQMWFLENLNEAGKLWFDRLKRVYDLLGALLILTLTLPAWPVIALIIKFESAGPVFYRQERLGKHNRVLRIYKFRTMTEDGNTRTLTIPGDPRITRFGNFLRKTRIDELPQVFNILRGEMSFIGPRPERPDLADKLAREIPFYNERMLVLPGATGWDQVCGEYHSPSVEDTVKKLQYDLFYIKNRSVFLDLVIVLKTVRTVVMHGGV